MIRGLEHLGGGGGVLERVWTLSYARRDLHFRRSLAPGEAVAVGRDPGCRIHLLEQGGPPVRCRFEHTPDGVLLLFSESDEAPVLVNGEAVAFRRLAPGDRVRAGGLSLEVERRPVFAPLGRAAAAEVRYETDFGRAMLRAVGKGQWLALSLALHLALLILLFNVETERRNGAHAVGFVQAATEEPARAELLPDPPPPPPPAPDLLEAPREPASEPAAAEPVEAPPDLFLPALGPGMRPRPGSGSGGRGGGGWTRLGGGGDPGALGGRAWREHVGRLQAAGMDVAVLFDSTGSMAGFIEEVKDTIEHMIHVMQWIVPDLRMALITYKGDRDASAYVTRRTPLTPDAYELLNFMRSVEISGGSAEGYAAVEAGFESAVSSLDWRSGVVRVIVLIGDAPPFPREQPGCVTLASAFGRAGKVAAIYKASESEALGLKEKTLRSFRKIALAGHGPFLLYDQGGSAAKRIVTAVLGPEWELAVERAFDRKGTGPWLKVLHRKEGERDLDWLLARFIERRVRPELVDALVRLGGVEVAAGIWQCLQRRDRKPWVVQRSLYVLDRITGLIPSYTLEERYRLTSQRLFQIREALRHSFGKEVFNRTEEDRGRGMKTAPWGGR